MDTNNQPSSINVLSEATARLRSAVKAHAKCSEAYINAEADKMFSLHDAFRQSKAELDKAQRNAIDALLATFPSKMSEQEAHPD